MTSDSGAGRHRLAEASGANSEVPPCVWCQSRRLVPTGTALEGWERYRCADCLTSMHVVPPVTSSQPRSWFRVVTGDVTGQQAPWVREILADTPYEATETARARYATENAIPKDQITVEITDGGWRL